MAEKRTLWDYIKLQWHSITRIGDEIDTDAASEKIRHGINVKGTTVWILVCSIVIASVGLNVNSIPVIIGAMLVSPLMGPIFGMGLSLSINDRDLLIAAIRNFLVMVVVSLLAATLYFLLTPLKLANPSELLARTSPTIFDVFIALFGGAAGTLEYSRKERGTVLSGVAIATALMPPLCTAGFGLASGNMHYFFGALYLFLINTVFILLATLVVTRSLKFKKVGEDDPHSRRWNTISSLILLAIIVPSVLSAISMIRQNNIERNVHEFIEENKTFGNAYIYDYSISGGTAKILFAGELSQGDMEYLQKAAERHGINPKKLDISVNSFGAKADELLKGVYEKSEEAIAARDARIKELEGELQQAAGSAIPYTQITKELKYKYPSVSGLSLSRGSHMRMEGDSVAEVPVTNALIQSAEALTAEELAEITCWLRLRLSDSTVVANNIVENE
jgi:uncharacterized hydrophobic protein (TIGR00271 family)